MWASWHPRTSPLGMGRGMQCGTADAAGHISTQSSNMYRGLIESLDYGREGEQSESGWNQRNQPRRGQIAADRAVLASWQAGVVGE